MSNLSSGSKLMVLAFCLAVSQSIFPSIADQCIPELQLSGGDGPGEYKSVHAKVPASDLARVINDLDDMGVNEVDTDTPPVDPNLPRGVRCSVYTLVSRVSDQPVNGIDDVLLTVRGNCDMPTWSNAAFDLEVNMIRSEIESLYKIPNLTIDPSWNVSEGCEGTGGGVTGSN